MADKEIESVEDSVKAAMEKLGAEVPESAGPKRMLEAPSEPPDEEVEEEADEDTPKESAKSRDESGKFAKKQEQVSTDQSAEESVEAQDEPIEAPIFWSAEDKEAFRTGDANVMRQLIAKNDKASRTFHSQKVAEAAQEKKRWEAYGQTLEPYLGKWGRRGEDPTMVLKQMLEWQDYFEADPYNAAREFLGTFGIDPRMYVQNGAANGQSNGNGAPYGGDPAVMQRIASLEQMIQSQVESVESQQMEAIANEATGYMNELDERGNHLRPEIALDDNGNPMHPAGEVVLNRFAKMIEVIRSENPNLSHRQIMEEAYDAAVMATKPTREERLAQLRQVDSQKKIEKAKTASRAASSIKGAPGGKITAEIPEKLEDVVRMAAEGRLQ